MLLLCRCLGCRCAVRSGMDGIRMRLFDRHGFWQRLAVRPHGRLRLCLLGLRFWLGIWPGGIFHPRALYLCCRFGRLRRG